MFQRYWAMLRAGATMAILNNDKNKYKEYVRFASRCLEMVAVTNDQESRSIQREMAAEWLTLADAVRPSKIRVAKRT
jgi:hypothetical protein